MLARLATFGGSERPLPTFVSSSGNQIKATTNTVSAPTGIQNGDLLIAVGINVSTGYDVTLPTGFSIASLENQTANSVFLATKIASSESGGYSFVWSGTATDNVITILVYRNATRINTIGSSTRATQTTGTASSITPTYAGVLCAFFANEAAATISTAPSGMTQRAAFGSSPSSAVYDLSPQAATATSAKSLVWSASGTVVSFQFQVTNEPIVAPEFVASASTSNSNGSSTLVISKPTGTAEGDLMVAVMASDGTVTWSGDTGWTELADQGSTPSLCVAYKIAGASEGPSYTFTSSNNTRKLSGSILTYRYAAYDVISSFVQDTNPLVIPSISPSQSQSILLATGARNTTSVTPTTPVGMTAVVTDSDANSPAYIICSQVTPKGSTGTRSINVSSNNGGTAGIMLAIKPTRSL